MKAVLQQLPIPRLRSRRGAPHDGQMFAAVDLGSNSFHMIVARHEHGELVVIDRLREMVRLAAGLNERRELSEEARQRALETLGRFGQRLRDVPAPNIRAAATNTLREMRHPRDFLQAAEDALGLPIEIISGREEARLVYIGVSQGLAEGGRRLVIDVGGGSTEFIIGEGRKIFHMESLQIGCVTLTNRFFADGTISRANFRAAEDAASLELENIKHAYQRTGWHEAVGSSGSVRALQEIAEAQGWEFRGVSYSLVKRLRGLLLEAGHVNHVNVGGLSSERGPVFPAAIAILSACFRQLRIKRMRVSALALREGLLYDLVGRREHADPREVSIRAMARRYGVDMQQARRVTRSALDLFDQAAAKWKLTEEHRKALAWAGRIHEVGLAISHNAYQRHGAYLVQHSDMNGFSWLEQLRLAVLVQNHRRGFDLRVMDGLPARMRLSTTRLCVLLRLSALMHRSRSESSGVNVLLEIDAETVRLTFPPDWLAAFPLTRTDLDLEREALRPAGFQLLFE